MWTFLILLLILYIYYVHKKYQEEYNAIYIDIGAICNSSAGSAPSYCRPEGQTGCRREETAGCRPEEWPSASSPARPSVCYPSEPRFDPTLPTPKLSGGCSANEQIMDRQHYYNQRKKRADMYSRIRDTNSVQYLREELDEHENLVWFETDALEFEDPLKILARNNINEL